jgi:hypothetical protein
MRKCCVLKVEETPKMILPMQHFTQDEFMPNPATILFLKQFARMCNSKKQVNHGYNGFTVAPCS